MTTMASASSLLSMNTVVLQWRLLVAFWLGTVGQFGPVVARENSVRPEKLNGEFDDLNRLLEGAVVMLPDARVSNDLIVLSLRNIRCTNFSVQEIVFEADKYQLSANDSFERTTVQLAIEGLNMICYLDYEYTFIFTRSGKADLYSFNNRAAIGMGFQQKQFVKSPDTTAFIEECLSEVNVNDLDFRGDVAAVVFNTVEKLMRGRVEDEAEKRLCLELESLSNTMVSDVLQRVDSGLAEFQNIDLNPLRAELDLRVPKNVKLMDLRETLRTTAQWLDRILDYGVEFATKPVKDEVTGATDMNMNVFIRNNFLEEGALILDANSLNIFQNHDSFLDISVVLERVRIFGLDQITSFEPLIEVGRYTVQNKVKWKLLRVEMDVSIDIKASTKEDSIFVSRPSSNSGTQEQIKVEFGIQNVEILLSILLAVDEKKLGALRLGALLYSDKITECLLSTVHDVQISGLTLDAAVVLPPIMEGFVSRGIDRVVSDMVDAAFLIYEAAIFEAAPGFFHTIARSFLNEILDDYVKVDVTCFIPLDISASPSGFTDFRDLLLPPGEALAAGGLGTEPYGDLPHSIVSQLKEQFLSDGNDGGPRINGLLRDALIGDQSNTNKHVVEWSLGDLLKWNTTVVLAGLEAFLGVQILDARIGNLDSFGSPIKLFDPISGEANILNNYIAIGIGSKPFQLSANVLLTVTDYEDLQLTNEVAVRLELVEVRFALAVLLQILEDPLFSVPIEDTLNVYCWLTTIFPESGEVNSNLLVSRNFSLGQLLLNVTCVSCSSPTFSDLIYGLYSPDEVGNATTKVLNLLSLARDSDFLRVTTEAVLHGASKQCPHKPDFDPDFSYSALFMQSGSGGGQPGSLTSARDKHVIYFNVGCAALSILVILTFFCIKNVAKHKYRVWRDTIPDEALARLCAREEKERVGNEELNQSTDPMFLSSQLPYHIRLAVPLLLVATIGIQIVGHLAVLSKLHIEGQIAGDHFTIHNFLEFKFIEACLRSYRNGGSEMAILLFAFTGIWPYIKLLTCLALWFLSLRHVSVATRGSVLLWLDVFAKLSIVDILAALLAVATFLVYIGGVAERELAAGEFFTTRIIVVPCAGFYCMVISQRLTRISSSYLLEWHQQIVLSANRSRRDWKQSESSHRTLDMIGTSKDFKGSFVVEYEVRDDSSAYVDRGIGRAEYEELRERSYWRRLAIGMTGLTVLTLAVIGCIMAPSISLDAKELWGLFESGKTLAQVSRDYSLFRVVCSILVQTRFVLGSVEEKAGLGILLGLAIVTAGAFPVMKCTKVLRVWFERRLQQNNAFMDDGKEESRGVWQRFHKSWFAGGANREGYRNGNGPANDLIPAFRMRAWRHLEVYMIAFVVAIWQLGAVMAYVLHQYCWVLEQSFGRLVFLGLVENTTAECFPEQAFSTPSLLILACAFLTLLLAFLFEAFGQYRKVVDRMVNDSQ